jgi:hypothetical protein
MRVKRLYRNNYKQLIYKFIYIIMEEVTAVAPNNGLKNFIIGRAWTNSQDPTRSGSIKINRGLPAKIVLTADMTLFLTTNIKRDGKNDPDFNVSVLLPIDVADRLIEAQKLAEANIKASSVTVE